VNFEVDAVVAELQMDVQRKLGRFLIRIQQYERLIKALVIDSEHASTVDTILSAREERVKRFSNKSLGMVVDELKASYLKLTPTPGAEEPEDEPRDLAVDKPFFRLKMGMEMSAVDLARTTDDLATLVELRNRLVHRLIEDFNVWSLDGCNAALQHLDASYLTVDSAFLELTQWARTAQEARARHAAFIQSPEFLDVLIYGVLLPDGCVQWEGGTVVALLQKVEAEAAEGGWVRLETAIAALRSRHPDHTPQKYRCKNWRQVLARSLQFEVRNVEATETEPGSTWYRSRRTDPIPAGQTATQQASAN
jgi:hypothetical protein